MSGRILTTKRKNLINKKLKLMKYMKYYYILLLPTLAYFIIFHYIPMYGVIIAFKDYNYSDGIIGSAWVGFSNFRRLFDSVYFNRVFMNTVLISLYRTVFGFPAPIIFALLLNEVRHNLYKRVAQTISYLPHFVSWVILGGIIIEFLSPSRGIINQLLMFFDKEPINFLTEPKYFRSIVIITGIWQSVGWGTIVYLAAISSISLEQYESAYMDGANRFQMVWHITLPSIKSVIIILFILGIGRMLNAGFDQIFNLYNPMVYKTGDIIDTYVYRVGLVDMKFSFSTAVGLFKNIIGLVLVLGANMIAKRVSDDKQGIW